MYLLSWLPYRLQRFLGFQLGLLVKKYFNSRRKVAERNLELCFPDMTAEQRDAMLTENFKNMGLAFFETCMAWFWPDWRLKRIISFEGFEQLQGLKDDGRGVLILAIHSFNLELGARAFALQQFGYGVYRPNANPVYDWFQYRGRTRQNKLIDRKDVKQMLKILRQGNLVWYAPDHDYGKNRYAWAPLFAVQQACTTTGTHLLASAGNAQVVPFTIIRNSKGCGYRLKLYPVATDFPYDDEQQAAIYTNKLVERSILEAPEQYMWLHRRFKSRPTGQPSLYD